MCDIQVLVVINTGLLAIGAFLGHETLLSRGLLEEELSQDNKEDLKLNFRVVLDLQLSQNFSP